MRARPTQTFRWAMLYVLRLVVSGGQKQDDQDKPDSQDCLRHHDLDDWKTCQLLTFRRRRRVLETYL